MIEVLKIEVYLHMTGLNILEINDKFIQGVIFNQN